MLNACNLAIVSIMSMGMATSAMPNFDNPKNTTTLTANTVQNYTININNGTWQNQTYTNEIVNNEPNGLNNTGSDLEYKRNLTATNSYINVIGNDYQTFINTTGNYLGTGTIGAFNFQNYNIIENNTSLINEVTTKTATVYKLTPYNYNIDTSINLTNRLQFKGFLNSQDGRYTIIDKIYLYKKVYVSSQSNWDNLLDRQITKYQVNEIIEEIEDINNGYYYESYEELIEIYTGNGSYTGQYVANYIDEQEINITPKTDNYVVINYVPVIQAHMYDSVNGITTQISWNNILMPDSDFGTLSTNITGTNIIPTGTYEVIDVPGLMWQILTMPFAFVSQAFNLTLFPGTPYQLNISNLFLSIIAIMVFIWLITFFLKVKG